MDLIKRADAIDAIRERATKIAKDGINPKAIDVYGCIPLLESIPAVKPSDIYDTDEWCHDCKEYDQENHCCPRWNRVIRMTLEENRTYADGYHDGQMYERNTPTVDAVEVVRCRDCKHWVAGRITEKDDMIPPKCGIQKSTWDCYHANHYCGFGERKE